MNPSSRIKSTLVAPALESEDVERIQKAIGIWKTAVDAETQENQNQNVLAQRHSEQIRFWVPILAPLMTAAALVATLAFQIRQFRENAEIARDSGEDTAWREVLKGASDPKSVQSEFSLTLLKSFFDSPRYAAASREIAVTILGHMASPDQFRMLFTPLEARTTWNDVNDLTRIGANLNRIIQILPRETGLHGDTESVGTSKLRRPPTEMHSILHEATESPELFKAAVDIEIDWVNRALIQLVRDTPESERGNTLLDLTDFQFGMADVSGLDLRRAVLVNAVFYRCAMAGADLREIEQFDGSAWDGTPWWECAFIDQPLLSYLEKNWGFMPDEVYTGATTATAEGYAGAVANLRRLNAVRDSGEK